MGQVGAVWVAVVLGLIVVPSALGISLGISEAYMWVLVKTLEVGGSAGGKGGCPWRRMPRGAAPRSLPSGPGEPAGRARLPPAGGFPGMGVPKERLSAPVPSGSSYRGQRVGHVLPGISSARPQFRT